MSWKINTVALLLLMLCPPLQAESKRIEVYAVAQQYWDTQYGETLGEIAQKLLPNNPNMQQRLMKDIVGLNPNAFENNDPARMQANTRLWLPGNMATPDTKVDRSRTRVESFAWGNIKRPIR